ncbi:hypothetical protein ACT7DF_07465 [Bacillus cereus]
MRIEYGINVDKIDWDFVGEAEKAFFDAKFGSGVKARAYFEDLKKQEKLCLHLNYIIYFL